ncbi:MAG: multiheme c-type cytochrome, partial [Woeseiaceae bacterium]
MSACGNDDDAPTEVTGTAEPVYVGSAACRDCHSEQHAQWSGSHHQLAMQPATAETVTGDFSGTSFDYAGTTYEFFTRG